MYAILGITGKVGGAAARTLLDAGQAVRAIVRDLTKGAAWAARGCEVARADITDPAALAAAITGVEGVFVLIPPIFDPAPGFPEIKAIIASLTQAITAARAPKIVCLSTIGAQASQPNLLNQLGEVERALGALPVPVCFLRAAWFMENAAWDVEAAREGVVPSFLQPLDKPVSMVATADIGQLAAQLLCESWTGRRVVEFEGPHRVSPNDIATAFTEILGHPVHMKAVPRENWEALFAMHGMRNPSPRAQMLDGFNQEWICFERGEQRVLKGTTPIATVLRELCRE